MNVRQTRRMLWMVMVVCLIASVLVGWWITRPIVIDQQDLPASAGARIVETAPDINDVLPPLDPMRQLADRSWRSPLYDPPPPPPPKPVPPPPLTVQFEGAIIEPGRNVAMFSTRDGQFLLKRVGESIGDVKVLAITTNSVTIHHAGHEVVLNAPGKGDM